MGNYITTLAEQMGTQGANGILGMIMGGINDRRQQDQQEALQGIQIRGNKEMMDYNFQKQLEMWQNTNYQAQVEQMKKAGINPALLYGMSGGGGTTTGGGGQSVQGATAPTGGREMQDSMQLGIQYQLLKAQKENIQADTANKQADTANKPIQGENITADTGLKYVQTRIAKISAEIQSATIEEAIQRITAETGILQETNVQAGVKTQIDRATQQAQILTIQTGLIKALLDNNQVKAQTKLTETETGAIAQKIAQEWEKLRISGKQLNYEEWTRAIQQQLADFSTTHPNMEQIKGNLLDELIRGFRKIANIQ